MKNNPSYYQGKKLQSFAQILHLAQNFLCLFRGFLEAFAILLLSLIAFNSFTWLFAPSWSFAFWQGSFSISELNQSIFMGQNNLNNTQKALLSLLYLLPLYRIFLAFKKRPNRNMVLRLVEKESGLDGLLAGYELSKSQDERLFANGHRKNQGGLGFSLDHLKGKGQPAPSTRHHKDQGEQAYSYGLLHRAIIRGQEQIGQAKPLSALKPLLFDISALLLLSLLSIFGLFAVNPARTPLSSIFSLNIMPGDISVPWSSNIVLSLTAQGPFPQEPINPTLYIISPSSGGQSLELEYKMEKKDDFQVITAQYELENLTGDINYYFTLFQKKSPVFQIKVLYPPLAKSIWTLIKYPEYTGMATEKNTGGDIIALVDSKCTIMTEPDKKATEGFLLFDDSEEIQLSSHDNNIFSASFTVEKEGWYSIFFHGSKGEKTLDPPRHKIRIIIDNPPEVHITLPGEDLICGPDGEIPIMARIRDDFGIKAAYLEICQENRDTVEIPLLNLDIPKLETFTEYLLSLPQLNLHSGNHLIYRVKALDNHQPTQSGYSTWYHIFLPSASELFRQTAENQKAILEKAGEILKKHDENLKKATEIVEMAQSSTELNWQEKKMIQEIVAEHKAIAQEAQQLSEMLMDSQKRLDESDLIALQTMEKMTRIRELLDSLMGEDIKKMMAAMNDLSESVEIDPKMLEEFKKSFDREEYLKKVSTFEKLLENIKKELALVELAAEISELAEKQQALAYDIKSDIPDKIQEQERLWNQLNDIISRMITTSTFLPQPYSQKLKDKGLEKGEIAKKSMEEAYNGLLDLEQEDGDYGEINQIIRDAQTRSAGNLRELSRDIRDILGQMQNMIKDDLIHKVSELLQNTATMAKEVHQIHQNIKKLSSDEARIKAEILGDYSSLLRQWGAMAVELAGQTAFIDGYLAALYILACESLEQGAMVLDDSNSTNAYAPLEMSEIYMKQAILILLKTGENMDAAESAAGMEELLRQLREMAERQGNIAGATENILDMLMGGQNQSMAEMIQKMALEQATLGDDLAKLGQKAQSAQAAARLDALAEKMAEMARKIDVKRADKDLVNQQKEMVERLLDARRGLSQREPGNLRQAISRKTVLIAPMDDDDFDLFRLPGRSIEAIKAFSRSKYPDSYRELVKNYFKALTEYNQ